MRRRMLILVLLLVGADAFAQRADVRLHVLTDSVTVGERFEVAVAVEHGAGVQVAFPEPPDAAAAVAAPFEAGEVELLGARRLPPVERGAVRVDSVVFEAATFALDSARVGPVPIRLVQGGDTTKVRSPAAAIGVRSLVPEDAEEPRPLAPLAEFPRALAPWLLAALAVVLLAVAVWLWLRHRRRRPTNSVALPADEEARARFETLADGLPVSSRDVKPFYVELSDALRTYLARTLGVPAREMTSHELLRALARHEEVPDGALEDTSTVLRLADLAKFASVQPAASEHAPTLDRARAAVASIEAAREAARRAAEESSSESAPPDPVSPEPADA